MRTTVICGGVEISEIGLGGWELGGGEACYGKPSLTTARAVLDAARASGVNWVDTAEIYFETRNESLIGGLLPEVAGDLLVSTKLAPQPDGTGFRSDQVCEGCRASLKRLQREQLDIYVLHWPGEQGVPLLETWVAMSQLVEEGLVRAIGLSNYDLAQVEECHAVRPVDIVQIGLSLVDHRENLDLIRACQAAGIPVAVYEPLANGILSGRMLAELGQSWGVSFKSWDNYERLLTPEKIGDTSAAVERLCQLAIEEGVTLAQLSLAWVLGVQGVAAAIVGTRNPAHIEESASAVEVELRSSTARTLENIVAVEQDV